MIYNNLLLFLVAIFLFSLDTVPQTPLLPTLLSLILFVFTVVGFDLLCRRLYRSRISLSSAGYFWVEKRLSVLSLLVYGGVLHVCDAKYHLSFLSLGDRMPALLNVAGLGLFLLFLCLMWRAARRNYQHLFGRQYTAAGFILSNIKANLPIVLPWIILSIFSDALYLVPIPALQSVLASQWGDLLFFGLFVFFVVLFFPPLVRRLWGCRSLPDGKLKENLLSFCRKQNFSADLYVWPLFEGRVLTAGVMGIVPGLRYVLLTPAIMETMNTEELESVMAHEIGHVKWYHLLKYIFLIGGFSVFAGLLAQPFIYLLLSQEFFVKLITRFSISMETILVVLILIMLLFYFRFVFGYFIRNFERQADLHVLSAVGSGKALISAFEKIADMSGNIRNQKNWHHFGIGERIDCLEAAEQKPGLVVRHNKKVRYSLLAYVLILALGAVLVREMPTEELGRKYEENYAEAILLQKARQEPDKALWQRLMGDLMLTRKMETRALAAYRKAFSLEPTNPEIMNNLAWLLITSEDLSLRDPIQALTLARASSTLQPKGYILDTLATAYWANGFLEEAVQTSRQAAFADPDHRRFYQSQAARFMTMSYDESVARKQLQQVEAIEE